MNLKDKDFQSLLFSPAIWKDQTLFLFAFSLFLFIFGLCHWGYFLNAGDLAFHSYDWPKEKVYYSVFQEAFQRKEIPFHTSLELQGTYRFLSVPEMIFSPQLFLLKFMDVGLFVLAQTLLMYSIGFLGILWIAKKYLFSPFAVLILFFLFNCNGYITAHIAVGHLMWLSYFFLPFFVLFLLEIIEEKKGVQASLKLSLVLFFILLQGGVHFFQWCFLFLILFLLFNWRERYRVGLALALSLLLGAVRIIPSTMTFWKYDAFFLSGYPTLLDLIRALVVLKDHLAERIGSIFSTLGWWEYDLYVSLPGFLFILYFGIFVRFLKNKTALHLKYSPLDTPLFVLFLFSLSYFYLFISRLPIPLLNSERVSSRFIILPLLFLLVLSVIRFQDWLNKKKKISLFEGFFYLGSFFIMVFSLIQHSFMWKITRIEREHLSTYKDISAQIIFVDDLWYKGVFLFSLALSSVTFFVVLFLTARKKT